MHQPRRFKVTCWPTKFQKDTKSSAALCLDVVLWTCLSPSLQKLPPILFSPVFLLLLFAVELIMLAQLPREPAYQRGSENPVEGLPVFIKGQVVHGFGRGSKQLGIPTGNASHAHNHNCCNLKLCSFLGNPCPPPNAQNLLLNVRYFFWIFSKFANRRVQTSYRETACWCLLWLGKCSFSR